MRQGDALIVQGRFSQQKVDRQGEKLDLSGGSSTPSTPAQTVSGSTATTTVTAQIGINGTSTATVIQSQITSAIEKAQAAAKSSGEAPKVETNTLSDAARQTVGNHPVYNFSITSGGNTISEFDGTVTVSIPYTPADGEDITPSLPTISTLMASWS